MLNEAQLRSERLGRRANECNTPASPADLLKRHAERHDKREYFGYNSQPKPGRIKGVPAKRKGPAPDNAARSSDSGAIGRANSQGVEESGNRSRALQTSSYPHSGIESIPDTYDFDRKPFSRYSTLGNVPPSQVMRVTELATL